MHPIPKRPLRDPLEIVNRLQKSLHYSVAYLVGKSYGQQGQMLSVRLQYAF